MEEDLVTYQIALKLKEKGFDIPCEMYYHIHDDIEDSIMSLESTGGWCNFYNSKNRYRCAAPPISLVLKWLREKGIHINVEISTLGWYCSIYHFNKDENGLYDINNTYLITGNLITGKIDDSYEQAALAGIEYVLDNLI